MEWDLRRAPPGTWLVADSSRAFRLVKKLRGRSATEFGVRGFQLASAWLERTGLSSDAGALDDRSVWKRVSQDVRSRIPVGNADALLADFRHSPNRFFAGFENREATIRELRRRWPNKIERIVAAADAVCEGRFDLLGYKDLHYRPIDWHFEPLAAKRAPTIHWSRIDYLDTSLVGDHKLIWELNRHQYFITLGRAYWLTGDERYSGEIVRQIESWMDDNRPKIGVNWASSLELAYRSLSWLWALHFIRESESLRPATFARVLAFLDRKARHIARHLSTYFSPNTHLTGEALGLLVLGSCLPQLDLAPSWRATGRRILDEQLYRQVRNDGSYVEQSPHYHRYTVEIYLHALALSRTDGGATWGAAFDERLQSALDHAMFLTMPDGSFPLIGDDDGGQLLPLNESPLNDFRPALSTAAAAFQRGDYMSIAGNVAEQTLWLLGPKALSTLDTIARVPPKATSRCFGDGGFCVMRDDWSRESNYLLVDAGPHGFLTGGHAHADALSFVLAVGGSQLLIDPGTFVYSALGPERNAFRSTAAHNTATIDDRSSSEPGPGPFRWSHSANSVIQRWKAESRFDLVTASHDGFMRLVSPVRHERTVLYARRRYWIIRDRLIGDDRHVARLHFHCAPGVEASINESGTVSLRASGARVGADLVTFADNGAFSVHDDYVSPEYGQRIAASTCVYEYAMRGSSELLTFILPSTTASPRVRTIGSGVYEILAADFSDTHRVEPFSAGGRWSWMTTDDNGRAEEIVLDGAAAQAGAAGAQARGSEPDELSGAGAGAGGRGGGA